MKPAGWAWFLPATAALAGLAAAGAWSIRAGWADHLMRQGTVGGTERAIALLPDRAEYYARLAWLVSDDDPQKAKDSLRRAVELNPWDAQSWIELGLRAEVEGDETTSKKCLLRAAEVDREFLPRWTLANYYFRHDDVTMFWSWAKQAAAMMNGNAWPMFRLCGKAAEDGKLIDRLEIRDPEVRSSYLDYLLLQRRMDLIGPAVNRLLAENRQADVPLLLTACERLLEAGRVHEAAEIWNRLADAGKVPFRTPVGEGEQLVANGNFKASPASRGFDWRLPVVEGVNVSGEDESRPGLRVTFSGHEPQDCEALVQLVPTQRKVQYDLRFEYRTRGIASGVGLGWRITDASGRTVLSEGPSLASEADAEGHLLFETPAECRLIRLALTYHRTPGTTRMEGYLILRNVALKPNGSVADRRGAGQEVKNDAK
jgi:tetratricopeptide (TPR) repeat protein